MMGYDIGIRKLPVPEAQEQSQPLQELHARMPSDGAQASSSKSRDESKGGNSVL